MAHHTVKSAASDFVMRARGHARASPTVPIPVTTRPTATTADPAASRRPRAAGAGRPTASRPARVALLVSADRSGTWSAWERPRAAYSLGPHRPASSGDRRVVQSATDCSTDRTSGVTTMQRTHDPGVLVRAAGSSVTGHTGFKGAWLVCWLQSLGAVVHGVSLPGRAR